MNRFVVFFAIVLLVYVIINLYVCIRGAQAFSLRGTSATFYYILFGLFSASFILGMALEDVFPIKVSSAMQHIGGVFAFAVLYLFIAVLILDLIRLANYAFNFYPEFIKQNYGSVKLVIGSGLVILISATFLYSSINFNNIRVQELNVDTGKNATPTRLVMIADVHLGYTVSKKKLQKFVTAINNQNPDVVFISGDLIDRSTNPLNALKMDEDLRKINAPLGVYSVFGNHEYIRGTLDQSEEFIRKSNINLLTDTSVSVDNRFIVVGRDDKMNVYRKNLSELTDSLDKKLPIILLDHQPYNLELAENAGVDLQLSGHVHYGQMWPVNMITKKLFEIPYGYGKKGNTHYYVTSGLGIWGPNLRLGTVSEIVVINIK